MNKPLLKYLFVTILFVSTTLANAGEDGSAASIEGAAPLTATRYAHCAYPSQHARSARFTGKPYDEDLQAYVFPYRNYDATTARWRSADPAGYPEGVNGHFYAGTPSIGLDILGTDYYYSDVNYFVSGQSMSQINSLNDALQHYRSGIGIL